MRAAAERDLQCDADRITVARVDDPHQDGEIFVAAGCDRSQRYSVSCTESSGMETCNAWPVEEPETDDE